MDSNGSSNGQDSISQKEKSPFIEQGTEITSVVGALTLQVLNYHHERSGIKATIRIKGCELNRQDQVLLDSEKAREKFLEDVPTSEKTLLRQRLIDLHDHLRTKPVNHEKSLQGHAINFEMPQAWPDPVDSGKLLEKIVLFISRYVILAESSLTAIALWVIHTWCLEAADFSPILGIRSPQMRCGKSTLLRVLVEIVCKAYKSASASVAALFRMVEERRPTLLIDEIDSFLEENEELRGLLNEGVESGGTFTRVVGDSHEPRAFGVFCPKALAAIGNFPATVDDRAIPIVMKRRRSEEKTVRFQRKKIQVQTLELRRQLLRWSTDNLEFLSDDPEIPESLNDRQADCWRPLLAIAERVGGDWPEKARTAAQQIYDDTAGITGNSIATQLLVDLKKYFYDKDKAFPSVSI